MTERNPLQPTDIDILSAALHTPDADASDDGVAALLRHDPLGTVEDLTGSYRDKPALGFAFTGVHGARKDHVLKERGDTTFSMSTEDYSEVIEAYGFELLASTTVSVPDEYDPEAGPRDESWYLYVKEDDGLFLYFDTHRGQRNAAKVYYNWTVNEDVENRWELTSSGHFESGVWIGDHDAREAVCFNMDRLRANGTFSKPFPEMNRFWFNSYWEYPRGYDSDFDYEAITEAKIAKLPKQYQEMLGR